MRYTVKAVADMAGVSIRTLHHYDEIGLLKPASVSHAGYRHYTDADLERLQQVLFFRELDFSLDDIKRILDSPAFDRKQALAMHRKLLLEKQARLERLVESVDRTIDAMESERTMTSGEMFGGFDRKTMEAYRDEARERWGKDAVDASYRRVEQFTKADWDAVQTESDAINRGLADKLHEDPASPEVQELVGRWFKLINDRYYDCTPEIFRGLGTTYVEDSRFTAFYDKYNPGLAAFLRSAMHVYADRLEGKA